MGIYATLTLPSLACGRRDLRVHANMLCLNGLHGAKHEPTVNCLCRAIV